MTQRYTHLAPVALRLALGIVFLAHGVPKLLSPDGFAEFFGMIGLPAPFFMVLLVGVVEAAGGLALIIGKGTRVAAGLLAAVMLGAILTAKLSMGFLDGWEFDFVILAAAVSLVLSGPVGAKSASEA